MSTPPRGRICDDVTETVGGTPLVRLSRLARALVCAARRYRRIVLPSFADRCRSTPLFEFG
jgi:hypothetical protein